MRALTSASRWRRFFVLVSVVALLAAACGGDDDDGAGDTEASADVDPNGVLRIGQSLLATSSYVQLDPATAVTAAVLPHQLVYDTLLRAQLDGSYLPGLAESAEVVNPTTINIKLRSGIKFTDGTLLDAEAVKFNIERMAAANNPGAIAVEMKQVDTVTADGPLSVTVKLKTPIAGLFYVYLSRGEAGMIVSPTAVRSGVDLKTKPVGAGPYKLESLKTEDRMVFVKNPDFIDAEKIRIPRIEFVHIASPEASQNALLTKAIDLMDNITPDVVRNVQGTHIKVRQEVTDSVLFWGQSCKGRPPLDNLKVRQALNYGLDRDSLNTVLYDGKSQPQWGFWSSSSIYHDKALDNFYKRDIAKAKRLLTEAGYPNGLDIKLVVSSAGGISTIGSELIQQQWKEIGVNVTIVTSSNLLQDFFPDALVAPIQFFTLQRQGLDKVTRNLVPGSIGNICNWNHAGLNDLVAKIRAVAQDSKEAIALWKQLDRLALEEAMNLFGVFGTTANAWDGGRVGNPSFTPNFQGVPYVDVFRTFIKK